MNAEADSTDGPQTEQDPGRARPSHGCGQLRPTAIHPLPFWGSTCYDFAYFGDTVWCFDTHTLYIMIKLGHQTFIFKHSKFCLLLIVNYTILLTVVSQCDTRTYCSYLVVRVYLSTSYPPAFSLCPSQSLENTIPFCTSLTSEF